MLELPTNKTACCGGGLVLSDASKLRMADSNWTWCARFVSAAFAELVRAAINAAARIRKQLQIVLVCIGGWLHEWMCVRSLFTFLRGCSAPCSPCAIAQN